MAFFLCLESARSADEKVNTLFLRRKVVLFTNNDRANNKSSKKLKKLKTLKIGKNHQRKNRRIEKS